MNPANVDLKQTLNLPRTSFSMKANLPQAEPKMLARWAEEDLYGQIRKSRAGKPVYILHDGPPYANGRIHLGTAFNKIVKDFIVKSRTMAGYDSPYVPGWDCHGLPIEHKVDQELGPKKAQMTAAQIRRVCRKYAEKWVNLQREDFKRLGILGRWDDPYLTMNPAYQAVIARAFVDFLDKGYVYKGLKPVNWCIHDRTALAEAEVEYENHKSPSVWVRFALDSDPAAIDPALAGKKVYGLIWTTTPWTLPANLGIAFHPKFEYVAVEVGERRLHRRVRICSKPPRRSAAGPIRLSIARFPGHKLDQTGFPASFHQPAFARDGGRPRHAGAGNRRRPHRSRARPGRLRCRHAIRAAGLLPGRSSRALLRSAGVRGASSRSNSSARPFGKATASSSRS